jgi:hypothetical protein
VGLTSWAARNSAYLKSGYASGMKSSSLVWPVVCVAVWMVGAGCDDNRPLTSLPVGGEPAVAGQGNAGEPVVATGGSEGSAGAPSPSAGGQGGAADAGLGGTGTTGAAGGEQGGEPGEAVLGGAGGQGGG